MTDMAEVCTLQAGCRREDTDGNTVDSRAETVFTTGMTQLTTTYEIRRTLLVRPEDYDKPYGSATFGGIWTGITLDEAIRKAESTTHLGYPSRVIEATADGARRCVWVRP